MSDTFPKSLVSLYKTQIKPEKNAYVDDIEDYLTSVASTGTSNISCQYIKHDLRITLKLNLYESYQLALDCNYCKITNYKNANTTEKSIYYFITKTSVKSENTIELSLLMDTVNTLGKEPTSSANPYNFLSNTEIIREHRDRFYKPTTWSPSVGGYLFRKIDPESEGIVPIKLRKTGSDVTLGGDVVLNSTDNYNWYIIYKSDNSNGVSTELCADTAIRVGVQSQGASKTYTAADFESGKFYYFLDVDNPSGTWSSVALGTNINKCVATAANYGVQVIDSVSPRKLTAFVFWNDSGTLKYTCIYDNIFLVWDGTPQQTTDETIWANISTNSVGSGVAGTTGTKWTTVSSITCTQGNFFRVSSTDYTATVNSSQGIAAVVSQKAGIYVGSQTSQLLSTIEDVDRTNSKIVKIIKYPYCPIDYSKTNSIFDFGNDWTYTNGFMLYNKTGIPTFGKNSVTRFSVFQETKYYFIPSYCQYDSGKNILAESKLFHSDLYTVKLVYDSFSNLLNLEHFDLDTTSSSSWVNIDFKPTSTINSKFAFKMDFSNIGTYRQTGDFDQYLLTTRNNEETILNNEYINYIKNGYNYDKKANALAVEQSQRSARTTTAGTILSTIGAIASFAAAPVTGGASVAAGIGLATGAVTSAISAANAWDNVNKTIENQNNTMAAKLADLRSQSASTSGTDDVDLMSWYSGNRLHLMRYEANSQIKEALYNAFDLTGYSHHAYEQPSINTRYWYNFIQCTPSIDYEGVKAIKQEWLTDLKERYRNGVTVFHNHIINSVKTWNFNQLYENLEKWIVDGISS